MKACTLSLATPNPLIAPKIPPIITAANNGSINGNAGKSGYILAA